VKNLRRINKTKKIITGLIIIIVTIAIWLTIFEIALRLFFPQSLSPSFKPTNDKDTFTEYDSVLGWRLKPNTRGHFFTGEFQTFINNNEQGLRMNRTIALNKSKFRIAFLGDSNVWGFGVNDKDRMSEQLERILKNIEVINFGVSGYGTDQYYLQLNTTVLKYNPDAVITTFYPNDLIESGNPLLQGYPKPFFNITLQGLVLTNVPVPQVKNWGQRDYSVIVRINFFLSHTSHTYVLIKPLFHKIYLEFTGPGNVVPYWIEIIKTKPTEEYANYIRLNKEIYCGMTHFLKQRNITLTVVNIPHRSYLIEKELKTQLKDYHVNKYEIDIKRPSIIMSNLSKECGFNFVDMYPHFKNNTNPKEFYYLFDEHLTAKGHKYIAEILAKEFKKEISKTQKSTYIKGFIEPPVATR